MPSLSVADVTPELKAPLAAAVVVERWVSAPLVSEGEAPPVDVEEELALLVEIP